MEQQSAAPKQVRSLVNFLRSSNGPKTKVGLLNGKRHDYFKGTGAVKALLSDKYKKAASGKKSDLPEVRDEKHAEEILHTVIPFAFFLRVDRADVSSKEGRPLQINQMQMFRSELYYAWFYEGSQLMLQLSGFGMILLMLAGVMFPLWPTKMRVGVWYLSVGMLGLIGAFFGLAIVRLIFWCFSVVAIKPGIWIFPNLFEDVGFVDSFIPLWAWDIPPPKKKKAGKAAAPENGSSEKGPARRAVANLPGQNDTRPQAPELPRAAADTKPANGTSTPTKGRGSNNASSNASPQAKQRLPEQASEPADWQASRTSDKLGDLD